MSLIADALKTAQREKQLRDTGRPSGSPLLVQLRPSQSGFSWPRALTMGGSVIVIVASLVVLAQRMKPKTTLTPLPPVPSPLAGTPLLADPPGSNAAARMPTFSAPALSRRADSVVALSEPMVPRPVPHATIPDESPRRSASVSRRQPPAESRTELQGQPNERTPPIIEPARAAPPLGRLRIAVEQPTPSDAARLFAEALTAHRAGNLLVARPLYERVLAIAPNDADALNNLGVLLSAQREFDRALEMLRRAASIAPGNAATWNNIGAVLREQGRGSDASAAFRHALTIDPQHQGAKVGLAQEYLATRAPAQARALLDEVLALNPNLPEAHYTLGQTLELLGDRPGAIRSFSAFIRLAPARLSEHVERVRRHVDSLSAVP